MATQDGSSLEFRSLSLEHNHAASEALFQHLPQQRRLPPELQAEAMAMLRLRPDKKLLREPLESCTSKVVTLRDLSNLAAKSKKDNPRNDLQAPVKMLQDSDAAK